MAAGRVSDELQLVVRPMVMVSSPESRKKGTILRNFGVLEIFIFIFILLSGSRSLMLSAVFISVDMRDKYLYYSQ
jgi:hypothetical protein